MTPAERIEQLGIIIPDPSPPAAKYVRAKGTANLLFLSGHGPLSGESGENRPLGKVGGDLSLDQGRQAARIAGLHLLATLNASLGSLDRVKQVVKLLGFVNCAPGFVQTSYVVDGCSELLVDVFGDAAGSHARSAVGVAELPNDFPVEIEMIVEVE